MCVSACVCVFVICFLYSNKITLYMSRFPIVLFFFVFACVFYFSSYFDKQIRCEYASTCGLGGRVFRSHRTIVHVYIFGSKWKMVSKSLLKFRFVMRYKKWWFFPRNKYSDEKNNNNKYQLTVKSTVSIWIDKVRQPHFFLTNEISQIRNRK